MQMEIPVKYQKIRNLYDYGRDGELGGFIVKEKLDGANFRFMKNKRGEIIFGSKNVSPINDGTVGGKNLDTTFTSYAQHVMDIVDVDDLLDDHVYFAEAMMRHSINYDVPDELKVVGFDVYDLRNEEWRADWQELFEDIGLPTTRVYDINKHFDGITSPSGIADIVNSNKFVSMIDGESPIEGVIFADYYNQVFYKYKTELYQETNPSKKPRADSIKGFFDKYFTHKRIENTIMKMESGDLGYNPNDPFPSVVGHVVMDVFEEATARDLRDAFKSYYAPVPVYDEDGKNIHENGYDLQKMLEDKIRANKLLMRDIMALIKE